VRLLVGHAVELDGTLDGGQRQRQHALLPAIAQHEEVGGDRIAHQRGGKAGTVDERRRVLAGGVADGLHHRVGAQVHVVVVDEGGCRLDMAVDQHAGRALLDARQRRRRGRHHHVAAQHQVGAAGGDAHGV